MDEFLSGLKKLSIELPIAIAQQEKLFMDELLHWNKRVNLTAIRDQREATEKHLLDSLALLPYLNTSGSLLDMGSGGGLPGIPLAIASSGLAVTSVDSVGKKINFQKHIKRKLQLDNLTPIQARLEDLSRHLEQGRRFDYIVARAFSSLDTIVRFAEPWLTDTGSLLVMKGPEGQDELLRAGNSLQYAGFSLAENYRYRLPFSGSERQLLVLNRQPA